MKVVFEVDEKDFVIHGEVDHVRFHTSISMEGKVELFEGITRMFKAMSKDIHLPGDSDRCDECKRVGL